MKNSTINRRRFVQSSAVAAAWATRPSFAVGQKPKYRACVIGDTGRGNYGHGVDMAFANRDDTEIVAVADPDAKGLAEAVKRTKAKRGYADFHEMLEKEKPDLVAVCPRRPVLHKEMALAAIDIGAHLYIEKPLAPSLADADAIIQAAEAKNLKIAVAHQVRAAPSIAYLKKRIEEGLIGEPVELRGHGKEDQRAGGEDMMVLGTHIFDMMQFFAGNPIWCMAHVYQDGRDIRPEDVHSVDEELGPIAGNDISATYRFDSGVNAYFRSKIAEPSGQGRFGFEIYGSTGIASVRFNHKPFIWIYDAPSWSPETRNQEKREKWIPLPGDPGQPSDYHINNRLVIDDLLQAIENDRRPFISVYEARTALEMILAPYASQICGCRVPIPMQDRRHPLADFAA